MRIHEYQAKKLLSGLRRSRAAGRSRDLAVGSPRRRREDRDGTVVVKAQIHAGGRGKAGGILKAANPAGSGHGRGDDCSAGL